MKNIRYLALLLLAGIAAAQTPNFISPSNAPLGTFATLAALTAMYPSGALPTTGGPTAFISDGTGMVQWNGSAWVVVSAGAGGVTPSSNTTFTNKTYVSPIFSGTASGSLVGLSNIDGVILTDSDLSSGTNTFPTALVNLNSAQSLSNKDLSSLTNTLSRAVVPNADCTGTTDATSILNAAIASAATQSTAGTVLIPANCTLNIATGTIFIFGNVSVVGQSQATSVIKFNAPVTALRPNSGAHSYAVVGGIRSVGDTLHTWTGEFRNLKFITTSTAAFETAVLSLSGTHAGVRNSTFDFTTNGWVGTTNNFGRFFGSRSDSTWASGAGGAFPNQTDLYFIDNYATKTDGPSPYGGEGASCEETNGCTLRGNHVYGEENDMLACHICLNVRIEDNDVSSLAGRIYVGESQYVWIERNRIQHQVDTNGLWSGGGGISVLMDEAGTTTQANAYVNVVGNTIVVSGVLDSGSNPQSFGSFLVFSGVQEGLIVRDNTIQMDSNYGIPGQFITTQPFYLSGWTGPAGNPDYSNGGHVKVRDTLFDGNKVTGVGAGKLLIYQGFYGGTVHGDYIGPIVISNNIADSYTWSYGTVDFRDTNRSRNLNNPFAFWGVSVATYYQNKSYDFPFTGLTDTYIYNNLCGPIFSGGVTCSTSTGIGAPFIAKMAGHVIGACLSVGAAAPSGNIWWLTITDNGTTMQATYTIPNSPANVVDTCFDFAGADSGGFTTTASLSAGATSATLTGNWTPWPTGAYWTQFSDGEYRLVTLTNGAKTATWTGGLYGAVTTAIDPVLSQDFAAGDNISIYLGSSALTAPDSGLVRLYVQYE